MQTAASILQVGPKGNHGNLLRERQRETGRRQRRRVGDHKGKSKLAWSSHSPRMPAATRHLKGPGNRFSPRASRGGVALLTPRFQISGFQEGKKHGLKQCMVTYYNSLRKHTLHPKGISNFNLPKGNSLRPTLTCSPATRLGYFSQKPRAVYTSSLTLPCTHTLGMGSGVSGHIQKEQDWEASVLVHSVSAFSPNAFSFPVKNIPLLTGAKEYNSLSRSCINSFCFSSLLWFLSC